MIDGLNYLFTLYLFDFLDNRASCHGIPHCGSSFQHICLARSPVFPRLCTAWLPTTLLIRLIKRLRYPAIVFESYFSSKTSRISFILPNRGTTFIRKLKSVTTIAKIFATEAGAFLKLEMHEKHFFRNNKPVSIVVDAKAYPCWFRDFEGFWEMIAVNRTFWNFWCLVKAVFCKDKRDDQFF